MLPAPGYELPDPFQFRDTTRVQTSAQWPARRREIASLLPLVYGDMPPSPTRTDCIELHTALPRHLGGARLLTCGVQVDGDPVFALRVFVPPGPGPFAVVLNGDACWNYAGDAVVALLLQRGYALAQFNRVEIASDRAGGATQYQHRVLGPYPVLALAAWAWAFHRAVDAVLQLDWVAGGRIAVVGHSRGGKAALLAGATDERIAVTSANNSGAGGAGCFRWQGPGSETLADIVAAFPHWFAPQLQQYAGRENELPFDQHLLKALVAPRALLTTEALGDAWANPQGSWQTHRAAREVYRFLGAEARIATTYRGGGHEHGLQDWTTLLDFCDSVFHDGSFRHEPLPSPFPDLPPAFHWRRP